MKIRRPAFTLLEMMIVLGITALTMLIGWPSMQRTIQKNEERQFWQTFRQAWQAAQVRSKTSNESTRVFYLKSHSQVVFSWASGAERINVPDTLLVRRFNDVEMKKTGYVSPQTEEFISTLDNTDYQMRIQLAWGSYHVQATQKKRHRAVMLGESVSALAIAALSIVFLMISLNGLNHQRKIADEQLAASRLAKEASDALKNHKDRVSIVRDPLRATADRNGVVVERSGKCILKLERR
ncbi:prepilin-type N-terminal cleavage/methylation domain-containing protein [Limosilactobacillus mucosae]|uniref:prepilin-type N-terminal cleavage/methylation domain-containing protein n=1 Tax=Limosilactobacillus mucosae TaxID=97478 RepID=UPI0039969488